MNRSILLFLVTAAWWKSQFVSTWTYEYICL